MKPIEDIVKEARELLSKPNSVNWNYFCDKNMPQILDELEKLQHQNQILLKAVNFYADKRNWESQVLSSQYELIPSHIQIYKEQVAQEALKKVSEF